MSKTSYQIQNIQKAPQTTYTVNRSTLSNYKTTFNISNSVMNWSQVPWISRMFYLNKILTFTFCSNCIMLWISSINPRNADKFSIQWIVTLYNTSSNYWEQTAYIRVNMYYTCAIVHVKSDTCLDVSYKTSSTH